MKKKIVIASVLKPVDEVRMYEKFAYSITKHFPECEIHILGAKSTAMNSEKSNLEFTIWNDKINHLEFIMDTNNQQPTSNNQPTTHYPSNIFIYPIADFQRFSNSRWEYGKVFIETVLEIKPNLLIINSPELLLPSLFIKIKLKIPVIYDVLENYYRNILYQTTYNKYVRFPLALTVRIVEYLSRLWVSKYLLAEKNYEKEFGFSKGKSEVIENKYNKINGQPNRVANHLESGIENKINYKLQTRNKEQGTKNFIYTGTISEVYGTVRAIHFIKKIKNIFPESQLLIKGFCSDKRYLEILKKEAQGFDFIQLDISEIPMNHQEIILAMTAADVALLPYLPNKSTENCIPAKMYEYISKHIPMIVQKNSLWVEVCASCQAAIFIDFADFDAFQVTEKLKETAFYSTGNTTFALWETEEHKLIHLVDIFIL